MSFRVVNKILEKVDLPPTQKLVLLRLGEVANHDGSGIFLSMGRIAHESGVSKRTVQTIIARFREAGVLVLEQEAHGGRGDGWRPNMWQLLVDKLIELHPLAPWERGKRKRVEKGENPAPISASGAAPEKGEKGENPAPISGGEKGESDDKKGEAGRRKGCNLASPEPYRTVKNQARAGPPALAAGSGDPPAPQPGDDSGGDPGEASTGEPVCWLWEAKREAIIADLGETVWRTWLKTLVPTYDGNGLYRLGAPTKFIAEHVQGNYGRPLARVLGRERVECRYEAWVSAHLARKRRQAELLAKAPEDEGGEVADTAARAGR